MELAANTQKTSFPAVNDSVPALLLVIASTKEAVPSSILSIFL